MEPILILIVCFIISTKKKLFWKKGHLYLFTHIIFKYIYNYYSGESNGKLPQELAQDAVCQSHTGHVTGLWFLPVRPLRLNTNE